MVPVVLFDMNGVLIDDEQLHQQAFQVAGSTVGLALTGDDYVKYFAGRTDRHGLTAFLHHSSPGRIGRIDDLLSAKLTAYRDLADGGLRSCDGATDLVMALREAGHRLGLVTGSTRGETAVVLDYLKLTTAFDTMVTADDVHEGKPSPEPFLTAATRLGAYPAHCVVIEDSPSGVAAAAAAGMACIAITSTHTTHDLRHAHLVSTVREISSDTVQRLTESQPQR